MMLVVLGLAEMRLELATDLIEELVEPTSSAVGRGDAPHTTMTRIHGHCM